MTPEGRTTKEKAGFVVRAILMAAAAGVVITAVVVMPGLGLLLRAFMDRDDVKLTSVGQTVRRLERGGYVRRTKVANGVQFSLTARGRQRLDQYLINDVVLPSQPPQWDGLWRIVLFDVPEDREHLRRIFRRKLQQLGFVYLQRSAWAYPFPCEETLIDLTRRLGIHDHVHIAVAKSLSSDRRLRNRFAIETPPVPLLAVVPAATTDDALIPLEELV